jgi:FMN-dependent NADH-azoreductase
VSQFELVWVGQIDESSYIAFLATTRIEDLQTVRAEGMNIPPLAVHAVPNGEKAVEALVI